MAMFRQAAIMADLGVFTTNEIRRHLGYGELKPEDVDKILDRRGKSRNIGSKTIADIVADELKSSDESVDYPMTPHSEEQTLKPE